MKDMPRKTPTRQHWVCILFSKYLRQSKLMAQHLMITCQLHHMKLCSWSNLLKNLWIQTPCWIFPGWGQNICCCHPVMSSFTSLNTPERTPGFFGLQGTWLLTQPAWHLFRKFFGISPRRSHSRYIEVLTWFGMCQPLADLAGCIQKKGTEWHWIDRVSRWASPRCDIWGLPLWSLHKIAHTFKWFHMLHTTATLCSTKHQRRKFRSQTSDNMDRWKSRGGKSQKREEKRRRKKIRQEKESEDRRCRCAKRKEWFVAPEGRKVGSLKRRVRSQLARGEM